MFKVATCERFHVKGAVTSASPVTGGPSIAGVDIYYRHWINRQYVATAKPDGTFEGSFCPYNPDDFSGDVFIFQGRGFLTSTMPVADYEIGVSPTCVPRCWQLHKVMDPTPNEKTVDDNR
jgi:hypothetical protein